MEKDVTNRAPDHGGKSNIPSMEEVANRAPDYPSKKVTENRDSHSWHINKNVLLISLLVFSGIVIAYMLVETNKANGKTSKQSEIIDSLQKKIDGLTTNLRGCDELKVHCGREKQENDKLKQTTLSQSDIITSVKEAKERESGIREYVQKDVEDTKTRLSETERKLDRANYENKELTQEVEVLTQEMKVLTQEIEVVREKLFGANEELNDCRRENWWHWVFASIVIFIIVLACCLFCYHNIIGTEKSRRRAIAY